MLGVYQLIFFYLYNILIYILHLHCTLLPPLLCN
nr:MAG TPA: hypothetical protein [Caudoviricetes sp.]